jgi:hypothetical protein
MTPDGYVWFVRRRRARRRPFWARRPPGQGVRYHDENELAGEPIPLPGPLDLFTTRGEDIGQPGFDRIYEDDRYRAYVALEAILLTLIVVGVVAWLIGELTAAIRAGRIDRRGAVILPAHDRR